MNKQSVGVLVIKLATFYITSDKVSVFFKIHKYLIINFVIKIKLKFGKESKEVISFASTISELLSIRKVHESYIIDSIFTNNNTPSMPLHDAHLEGFLFL